jgi:hypothetical protein
MERGEVKESVFVSVFVSVCACVCACVSVGRAMPRVCLHHPSTLTRHSLARSFKRSFNRENLVVPPPPPPLFPACPQAYFKDQLVSKSVENSIKYVRHFVHAYCGSKMEEARAALGDYCDMYAGIMEEARELVAAGGCRAAHALRALPSYAAQYECTWHTCRCMWRTGITQSPPPHTHTPTHSTTSHRPSPPSHATRAPSRQKQPSRPCAAPALQGRPSGWRL